MWQVQKMVMRAKRVIVGQNWEVNRGQHSCRLWENVL